MNHQRAGTVIAVSGLAFLAIVGTAVGFSACSTTPDPQQDLPDEKVEVNIAERLVYANPDKFPNVLAWCDGPVRIYVTTRDTQNFEVVPNHPFCTGGEPGG